MMNKGKVMKNKTKLIILIFLLIMNINIIVGGQHLDDLTDREILIQLIGKFEHLEKAVLRIEFNSDITRNKIISIDREIYKNSAKISNLSEQYRAVILRWNALLTLFTVFISGIFIFMWKKIYEKK